MGIEPSMSEYGSMTLLPPGAWPAVDEDTLAAAAQSYEALAARLRNVVVPQQQAQLVTLADQWTGVASQAAQAEGAQLVQGHENNATEAAAIANKLRLMEATVVRTKTAVNLTADETQANCDEIEATPAEPPMKAEAKAQAVAMGLAQNLQTVGSSGAQLSSSLGASQESSPASGIQGAQQAMQQAMQIAMQMGQQMLSQAGRLGQQFGQMAGGGSGPMQQMGSSLGQLASSHSPAGMSSSPSMFSNHPLAGGSGPSSGAGLMRPASFPGAGSPPHSGGAPGTPTTAGHGGGSAHGGGGGGGGARVGRASLMANVTSSIMAGSAPAAGSAATGAARVGTGVAPVAGAGGGMGGTGAMGHRETSGGTRAALAVPGALDHDLTDGAVDDEW